MAGRISDRDIAAIRERARIEEVVGDYVQLRRAGADSMKGLCPFHNEKSPSFHVRPNHGHFHCFGCGEGGDVYAFIQKIEHVSFVEAVELLADRIGHTISYSGPATSVQRDRGSRSRLIAANAAAAEFYAAGAGVRRGGAGAPVSDRAELRCRGRPPLRLRLRAVGLGEVDKTSAAQGFRVQRTGSRRPIPGGTPGSDGSFPPSAAVAHPHLGRRGDRFRRPAAVRRRPDGSQVRQYARDAAVQEVGGDVRHRLGQTGYRQGTSGRCRRGLHRRDGDASGRGHYRCRVLRHRVR